MSEQTTLDLESQDSGPVECLGQTFPSDEARREHYLDLLAEKLKDPEFRKIEGFPIGEDEDILAVSDPPYYTACPNPWIGEFIEHYGRPYDPKEEYHREPFAADVKEGKNHPIYTAHSYHTKVPHRAIMRYILHYTEPGDIVFDGFCGTGMTGVAAQLCEDKSEIHNLGFRIGENDSVVDSAGAKISRLGRRRSVLGDLAPAATFIAKNYNLPERIDRFEEEVDRALALVDEECGWMYSTTHADGSQGRINYTIWSDVFSCPECGAEIEFWSAIVDEKNKEAKKIFPCPKCGIDLTKSKLNRVWITRFDQALNAPIRVAKQVPIQINYSIEGSSKRFTKSPSKEDFELIEKIESEPISDWFPIYKLQNGVNTEQPKNSHGFTHIHHFYTWRNLRYLASAWEKMQRGGGRCSFLFTASQRVLTKMASIAFSYYFHGGGGFVNAGTKGTLYVSSTNPEVAPLQSLRSRKGALRFQSPSQEREVFIETKSLTGASQIRSNSVDYAFLDPPFGSNINYSELNTLWESWLGVFTSPEKEAIQNKSQRKGLGEYHNLMIACFSEVYRILKPGRWMTVEFSNTKAALWNSIQSALTKAGFVVANVSALDKKQGSFKAYTTPTAVKQDLVISAYKPNGGLEARFEKTGHTVAGCLDFLKTHLGNLPVVKARGGELEFIAERDPRILYDRMVAFYVGHGIPVPLSSAEFQAEVAEKFPERDGMVFLPDQVAEYDKKRAEMQGVGQMSIFVEDEKSAIDWLRNFLKHRPSVSSDITPEFMQQLGASWKKFETRPELSLLLEQNFLQYHGGGEVPSQIHSYLSTQNKDLRNLPKDDARLKSRAKDRWYVPDPAKAVDVESLRNKRLLQEFWEFCDEAGINRPTGDTNQPTLPNMPSPAKKKTGKKKLKEVRTEAVRLGFKECFAAKDYATILALADHLPANVIEEDENLQMIYDMAEMRAEG